MLTFLSIPRNTRLVDDAHLFPYTLVLLRLFPHDVIIFYCNGYCLFISKGCFLSLLLIGDLTFRLVDDLLFGYTLGIRSCIVASPPPTLSDKKSI